MIIRQEDDKGMSLELIRENIIVNEVIGTNTAQTVLENDIIVPDAKPDIAEILLLGEEVYIKDTEAMTDRIQVDGVINFKILYISEEENGELKSIDTGMDFSYQLDMPKSVQGMKSKVKSIVEHTEFNILNGRKINIKAVVKFSGKVEDEIEKQVVYDVEGIEDIQVLRKGVSINSYLGNSMEEAFIREVLEVPAGKPAIKEILRNDIKIVNKENKITDNKIIIKGEVSITTLYKGDIDEQVLQYMEHEIPFTQVVDMQGINEECTCEIEYFVEETVFEIEEDSDGELRFVEAQIGLKILADGFSKKSMDVVEDVYSPSSSLDIVKSPFKIQTLAQQKKEQIVLKETAFIENENPDMEEVFNVLSRPVVSEYTTQDNKVIVEGLVNNNILYLAENAQQPVFCQQNEIPFKQEIDIEGIKSDMECDIEIDVDHSNYNMISVNEVEIRLVINISVQVVKNVMVPLIVKINESALDDMDIKKKPSIIIYFSQTGDTFWEVAKRYRTTIDVIKKENDINDNEELQPGRQIIIPRRIS